MRRVSRLILLQRSAQGKLIRIGRRAEMLRHRVDDFGRALDEHQVEVELTALVVNLQSYWSNWCRALYLSEALGAILASGMPVVCGLGLRTEHDALTVAIMGTLTPKKPPPATWRADQEPKWFDPDILSTALSDAKLSIAGVSANYLNSARQPLNHMRTVRNYYAHRSELLKRSALALGPGYLVGLARKPSQILLFVEPSRSVSVLERWILDISRLATALCA